VSRPALPLRSSAELRVRQRAVLCFPLANGVQQPLGTQPAPRSIREPPVPPRWAPRKVGRRPGDNAPMVIVELLQESEGKAAAEPAKPAEPEAQEPKAEAGE
jgi:hypothetical protein